MEGDEPGVWWRATRQKLGLGRPGRVCTGSGPLPQVVPFAKQMLPLGICHGG